jgi:hypothetical protein
MEYLCSLPKKTAARCAAPGCNRVATYLLKTPQRQALPMCSQHGNAAIIPKDH